MGITQKQKNELNGLIETRQGKLWTDKEKEILRELKYEFKVTPTEIYRVTPKIFPKRTFYSIQHQYKII